MTLTPSRPFRPLPPQSPMPLFQPIHSHQYSLSRTKLPCPVPYCGWGKPHVAARYSA